MLKTTLKYTVLAAAAMSLPGLAAAEPVKLRVTNGLSPTHVVSTEGIEPWMACVTDRTGGEVTFDYFPGGQISKVTETTDAIANGLADIGFMSPSNEGSKLPLNGLAMLPGIGTSAVEITEAYRASIDAGSPLADELVALGLRPFILNALAPYQIMARNKKTDSLDSFRGVKTRVAGGAMNFTALALGAVPTEMPAGDLYIALERGTVDATILAKSSVKTYSLQELVTSMSSNASLGTSTQFFAISEASWGKLSAPHQEAVMSCGAEVEKSLAEYLDKQETELQAEFSGLGIDVYDFPPEELEKINAALEAATLDYVKRLGARGLPAQEGYDSLRNRSKN
ncbi:TRAP transporter substrate-binding protein DctP [Paracoccus sp. (in: a-proteobacteria)]|uniref:TRAP transporter substrate-binding protein n=1 Tax=Paracoccus sp. TaxID=267 RepID=UPI002AFDE88C|nr:TRAP transporter substrate-binding protein DctP [Paracoccus sp. (in: a-proteobacteria)]